MDNDWIWSNSLLLISIAISDPTRSKVNSWRYPKTHLPTPMKKTPKSSIGKISFCPFPITSSIIRFVICGDSMSRLTLITRQPIANAYAYHFSNRYFDIFFISFPVLLSSLIQQTFFAPKNLFLFQSATLLCSARNLLKILIKRWNFPQKKDMPGAHPDFPYCGSNFLYKMCFFYVFCKILPEQISLQRYPPRNASFPGNS